MLPPASPIKDRSGLKGSSSNKMLNYLCKFGQSFSVRLLILSESLWELLKVHYRSETSFIVEDDSYIFNGFREWDRDI